MSKAPAPTSEWADLFASLSNQDTSDTIDTRSDDGPETGPSVAIVKAVVTIGLEASATPQPAETLNFSDASQPSVASVASVASVTKKREKEISGTQPTRFPAADTSATLATEADSLEERAAIIEYGAGVPREWAEGYAAMSSMPPPAGFSPERWARIIDAAGTFIDKWAAKAAELGWVDKEIFGCDAAAPAARFDQMGLVLLLERMHVVAIIRPELTCCPTSVTCRSGIGAGRSRRMRCGSGILCDEPPNERGGQFVNRADYQAYLASREWALKREAVRERAHGRVNGMDAVHHRTYERVGNEHLDDLVAICDPCQEYLSGKRHTDPLTDGVAIYLAGPFLKPDWRQDLLAERQAIHGSPMLDDGNFTVMKRGLRGGFDAAGPWRLQTHGTNDHGILTDHGGGLCWCCDGAGAVVGVCKRSIARSDAVFAWLLKTVISAHRYFVGTWICRSAQEADCRRCSHRST